MPSPPLPPRIALTDDLRPVRAGASKRKGYGNTAQAGDGGKVSAAFANGLTLFCFVLMVALLGALWKWQKASDQAEAAAKQAAVASSFSDGVLRDLALAREQAAKLDRERQNLVHMLGEAERLHASLRGELGAWRQKHDEVVGNSQQALAQWNEYGKTLETNLGATRAKLSESNDILDHERSAAEQQLSRVEDERERTARLANTLVQQKNAVEREKQVLDQKAQSLNEENNRLDGDVDRMRGVINNLEFLKNELNTRNATLAIDVNNLRGTVGRLEAKIRALEQEKDRDRDHDKSKRSNTP